MNLDIGIFLTMKTFPIKGFDNSYVLFVCYIFIHYFFVLRFIVCLCCVLATAPTKSPTAAVKINNVLGMYIYLHFKILNIYSNSQHMKIKW